LSHAEHVEAQLRSRTIGADDLRAKLDAALARVKALEEELGRSETRANSAHYSLARVKELEELHGNAVGNCGRLGLALSLAESRLSAAEKALSDYRNEVEYETAELRKALAASADEDAEQWEVLKRQAHEACDQRDAAMLAHAQDHERLRLELTHERLRLELTHERLRLALTKAEARIIELEGALAAQVKPTDKQ
jgi:hypothetical protein